MDERKAADDAAWRMLTEEERFAALVDAVDTMNASIPSTLRRAGEVLVKLSDAMENVGFAIGNAGVAIARCVEDIVRGDGDG